MSDSNVTGWMTPSGKFLMCGMYMHLSQALDFPEIKQALGDWGEQSDARLTQVMAGCQDAIAHGEHPEWHSYEMASDSVQYKLREKLLKAGFLRVGTMGNSIHFEGKPHAIKNLFQKCKDFAEGHGMGYVFEKQ